MISMLAVVAFTTLQDGLMPIQFVPKAQFGFDKKETILESSTNQKSEIVLVNDENVSNEVLDAISKHKNFMRVVELFRKETSGEMTFWNPAGHKIANDPFELPKNFVAMEPGEVCMISETPLSVGDPQSAQDRPTIRCNLPTSRVTKTFFSSDKQVFTIQKIGIPSFKFSNIRFSLQVRTFLDTFGAASGTSKTINNVGFKVVGLMPDHGDKLEHFEVIQSGLPGMDTLALVGQYDWDAIEKDLGKVRNKQQTVIGRLANKNGEAIDPKEMHMDFASKYPVKYFSKITVLRTANMQGYFQHIATQPN